MSFIFIIVVPHEAPYWRAATAAGGANGIGDERCTLLFQISVSG
jgi:hypothetical protein